MLNYIKSEYFLKKIFNLISTKICLQLVNNNKNLQKKLSISIDDYIKFFYQIEIEINPINTLDDDEKKNIFINIPQQEKSFTHIYFNNDINKEIDRTYLKKDENVSKIKIILDKEYKTFSSLFQNCLIIKELKFKRFNRKNITDMSGLFYNCASLNILDITKLKTENVTNMRFMFGFCSSLKELNLLHFNTNKVTNISGMFRNCNLLESLDLSNFNTYNVTNMSCLFQLCSSLKKLNISNFNTKNVTNMGLMFNSCSSLSKLDLSHFNTENVTNMSWHISILFIT